MRTEVGVIGVAKLDVVGAFHAGSIPGGPNNRNGSAIYLFGC
ncbi:MULTISPECIES: hypothetical protein [unclassified Janthinobacterium]|nr:MULTISPECIES: hypothetical protein [unclassified Janthinobacterium]MEC5159506.1 hypothetical protein [Janthinobacterium sp. CG_S6]